MDVLQIFATVIGIVGLAGGAVGYFAKGRGDSIIQYQARELQLRDETINRLEKENISLAKERDTLKEQNEKLWERAQGTPQLNKLASEIKRLVGEVAALARSKSHE